MQQKGTRSAKRRLKTMSGGEKRVIRHINHCVSKELANQPEYKMIFTNWSEEQAAVNQLIVTASRQ